MGECGRGGVCGRGFSPMTWMGTCYGGGGMWQGVRACGRVWGNVAGVVIGCGGMWQGWGYVVGVRHMAWMGTCGK